MRFKKLELLGFKSFADPTELSFEPGITAIVGPNGCGKSNVADAIKWVLGEQSARELRGGHMEDLIFNGSDRRAPVNYAEVALTLDNADKRLPLAYSEITIARRLFRSGESEYLLNGTAVRLKDVTELLMGTGIGTSAYSLFEQGRIEQVINSKPEERRAIFEEAAGITKFKTQKREAMRKLDETEANLARVGDVIGEVKRQIQSIERQVRKAKHYQEQFEELKDLELKSALCEERRLTAQWREREEILQEIRRQGTELQSRMSGQEGQLNEARRQGAQADQALQKGREQLLNVTHQQETARHRLEVTRERIEEAQTRQTQTAEELKAAETEIGELDAQQSELAQLVAQADTERENKEANLTWLQARLDDCAKKISEAKEAIARVQEQLLEETGSQVQVKNTLFRIQQEVTRLEARATRLNLEETKVSQERGEASAQLERLEKDLTQAREALEAISQERSAHREKLAGTEASLTQAREKALKLEQERTRLSSQLELLKGVLLSHDGYSSGVKTLLTALDQGVVSREGVSGSLAELIQVGPSESAAVEAALGSWAQALVVESLAVAKRCRQYLEESGAGRVLFLIRDRVPNGASEAVPVPLVPGTVLLYEKLGITPYLEPVLKFLLANTWLVPDREAALALLEHFTHDSRLKTHPCIVTSAGELFTAVSAWIGSPPMEEGLVVGRKDRLQSLEIGFVQLSDHLKQAQESLASLQTEHRTLTQQLEGLEASFQERTQTFQRIEVTTASAQSALAKLEEEEALVSSEQKEVDQELGRARIRLKEWEDRLIDRDEILHTLQATTRQAQEEIAQKTRTREESSILLATAKAECASFDQVRASRKGSLQVLEQTLRNAQAKIVSGRKELEGLQESQKRWEVTCRELETQLEQLAQAEAQAQTEVTRLEGEKSRVMEAAQEEERQWMGLSREFEQLQSKGHDLEMQQAEINFQREQRSSRLQQLYQMDLETVNREPCTVYGKEEEAAGLGEKIQELSERLKKMGPVNLGSIEEEKELQSRYEFLVNQQNDLLKAKENLYEAITKINRTTRAMFRETFQAIQKQFEVSFKQLFGGGEARLVLLDEEDILESGIEIIARPPGKPLQAISLLSGGEKALTTIALLFAIFRVRPSPFCLLDEIDAPLDESNIGRFTAALKEFLKDSQFIIITHNKKTITMADCMYGITMEESGVSRIVSVKFRSNGESASNGNGASASDPKRSEPEPASAHPTPVPTAPPPS